MNEVQDTVKKILIDKLGIAATEITSDANMVKDLGIDSLDYAELVMEFETAFNIRIPDNEAEKLVTVKDAVAYIEKQLNN